LLVLCFGCRLRADTGISRRRRPRCPGVTGGSRPWCSLCVALSGGSCNCRTWVRRARDPGPGPANPKRRHDERPHVRRQLAGPNGERPETYPVVRRQAAPAPGHGPPGHLRPQPSARSSQEHPCWSSMRGSPSGSTSPPVECSTWGRKPRLALTPDQPFPQTSPGSGAGSALHQPRRHVPAPRIPGPSAVAWRIAGACYRAAGVTGERPRGAGPFLAIGLALVITLAGRQPGMTEPGGPLSPRR
jgi:hypothetical protein